MDDLDFFDFSDNSTFKREAVSSGACGGRIIPSQDIQSQMETKRPMQVHGTAYAAEFVEQEEKLMSKTFGAEAFMEVEMGASTSHFDELDGMSEIGDEVDDKKVDMNAMMEIYRCFEFNRPYVKLPILASREEILMAIEENPVVIVQGDTGCGKTTQIPQYILDEACQQQKYCNIVVTQPRKIAAISNSKRVAAERRCQIGSLVGYQVGLKAELNEQTHLLFCTTGVLLQKLIRSKNLRQYTHVILDEVHDRNAEMDFLFIVIRRLLAINAPKTKIILMSATIDATSFSKYFSLPCGPNNRLLPAPIARIDGKRQFQVLVHYYDDIKKVWSNPNKDIDYDKPGIDEDVYLVAQRLVGVCFHFDSKEASDPTVKYTILMFLPGLYEIERMYKKLKHWFDMENLTKTNLLLPLHSSITKEEQERVFREANPGVRKIILATNIAESSITVPNVRYVIDFCLTKSIVTETSTNYTYLRMEWASKNNCIQRAGRAGRVLSGRVYRLVSRHFFENYMSEHSMPEILRCPLENVVLKAKLLDMGTPQSILALAMDPPDLLDINNTLLILKEAGALLTTVDGQYRMNDGDLTFIGRVMAALPIDIRVSRLIIFGYVFSMLDECIIIAAGLNIRNIFMFPFGEPLKAYMKKLAWADGSNSDCFAVLRAYMMWQNFKAEQGNRDDEAQRKWGQRNYIQVKAMKEMNYLVDELKERLGNLGLQESQGPMRVNWTQKEQAIILKIIIAGAFYPHYFVKTNTGLAAERQASVELGCRDPFTTIYFRGIETKYFAPLYQKKVKQLLAQVAPPEHMKVSADYGCQKIFVTFKTYESNVDSGVTEDDYRKSFVPGRIVPEVYRALKLARQSDFRPELHVMPPHKAIEYAESLGVGMFEGGKWVSKRKLTNKAELSVLPSVYTRTIEGIITHVEHCNKFWFQPLNEVNEQTLTTIQSTLNTQRLKAFNKPADINIDQLVAAPYSDESCGELYFRARVLEALVETHDHVLFLVQFIDYGNLEHIPFQKLRQLDNLKNDIADIPPRAFECKLCEIEPSLIDATRGRWTKHAVQRFVALTKNKALKVDVYSVVDNVVSVTLFSDTLNINQKLIANAYAMAGEENYMSKVDHDLRIRSQRDYCGSVLIASDQAQVMIGNNEIAMPEVDPPPDQECRIKVKLLGPHSPLDTKLTSLMAAMAQSTIRIESESVNSILLDTDPQDSHPRLVVATSVSGNANGGGLTIRQTTVMPNIHGFAPLMALIFCPKMEARRDKTKSRYVSFMTGLGYHPQTKKALFPEHDVVFDLDVDIRNEDLQIVNHIRYNIDCLLSEKENQFVTLTEHQRTQCRAKMKELIIKLLETDRNSLEVQYTSNRDIWGHNECDHDLIQSNVRASISTPIFPNHNGLALYKLDQSSSYYVDLRRRCDLLHKLAEQYHTDMYQEEISCRLCDVSLETVPELRLHLLTKLHRDREAQINF